MKTRILGCPVLAREDLSQSLAAFPPKYAMLAIEWRAAVACCMVLRSSEVIGSTPSFKDDAKGARV
jgi:hypothetical protein